MEILFDGIPLAAEDDDKLLQTHKTMMQHAIDTTDISLALFLVMDVCAADEDDLENWEKNDFIAWANCASANRDKTTVITIH